jgi:16S rRNA processing protein RimM
LKSSSSTVNVGFVLRAHGIRGALRIRASTDGVAEAETLWLDDVAYRILHASRDKEDWLVTLEGLVDRNAAEAMRGRAVRMERSDIPVDDNEVLVADLVGCTVFDAAGTALGVVTGSFDSSAHEVLEVRTAGGKEFMLPLIEPIVTGVDVEARKIFCDPPPGLVNLDEAE